MFSLTGSHLQVASTLAQVPGTATSVASTAYTYPSPYGAPAPAGAMPPAVADPYAQSAVAPPGGAVQVAGAPVGVPPTGQPAGIPGNRNTVLSSYSRDSVNTKLNLCEILH